MIYQTTVLLIVSSELLLLSLLDAAMQFVFLAVLQHFRLQHKKALTVADILGIDRVEIALAEREVVDRIQHRGLARTIVTHKAVHLG